MKLGTSGLSGLRLWVGVQPLGCKKQAKAWTPTLKLKIDKALVASLQGDPGTVLIAATAARRRIGNQYQAANRKGVDPTARTDAAKVLGAVRSGEVKVTKGSGSKHQQVF